MWVDTSAPLYPNLYIFLVGHAGIGKSRTIGAAGKFIREIPDLHLGPNSVTMASLVDCLVEAKRVIVQLPANSYEYNSLTILADELSAFMPLYEPELIGGLTTFYDCVPYAQHRRGKDIRIKIDSPQLNILSGTTPSNLIKFVPEIAWEQGFMSRVIMVYGDERPMQNLFTQRKNEMPPEMIHDLRQIAGLHGQFTATTEFADAIHEWRLGGCKPEPSHPKLAHYNSRRLGHVLKLSMVSAVDRGNLLLLEMQDFSRALSWLHEAEKRMGSIFHQGQQNPDSQVMDEIIAFINGHDVISSTKVYNFARRLAAAWAIDKIINVMLEGGMMKVISVDSKSGVRMYKPIRPSSSSGDGVPKDNS